MFFFVFVMAQDDTVTFEQNSASFLAITFV